MFVVIENLWRVNTRFTSTVIKGLRAVHLLRTTNNIFKYRLHTRIHLYASVCGILTRIGPTYWKVCVCWHKKQNFHTQTHTDTHSATLIGTCSTLVECIFCAWQRALRYALSPPCYAWSRRQFCKSSNPMQLPFWTRARGCFYRKIVSRKYVKLIIFVLTLIRV